MVTKYKRRLSSFSVIYRSKYTTLFLLYIANLVNNFFYKNSCDTMLQDKNENGCRGNRNVYNILKLIKCNEKCKLYRIMFVRCKTSKNSFLDFGNWKKITAMTAIITKISQNGLLSHKKNVHYETIFKTDLYKSENLHFSFTNIVLQAPNWGFFKLLKQQKVATEFAVTMATSESVPTQTGYQKIPHKIWGKFGRFQLLRINYLKDSKEKLHGG